MRSSGCPKEACSLLVTAAGDCAREEAAACVAATATRAAALETTWQQAKAEYASLRPDRRQQIMARMGDLMERCPRTRLLPATVLALRDGAAALNGIHDHMREAATGNPEFLSAFPVEAQQAFRAQSRLIRAVNGVLERAGAAVEEVVKGAQ
jgi:hypothetical protein